VQVPDCEPLHFLELAHTHVLKFEHGRTDHRIWFGCFGHTLCRSLRQLVIHFLRLALLGLWLLLLLNFVVHVADLDVDGRIFGDTCFLQSAAEFNSSVLVKQAELLLLRHKVELLA